MLNASRSGRSRPEPALTKRKVIFAMAMKPLSERLGGVTRFGMLKVLREAPPVYKPYGRMRKAFVLCDCGAETIADVGDLLKGGTTSCGCMRSTRAAKLRDVSLKHSHTWAGGKSPEYRIWQSMKTRCFNPKHVKFSNYGGRGITVCQRWKDSFPAFLEDMGLRPDPSLTLDRINNDGDYEPANCRWATASEQNSNRRPRNRP